MKILAFESSVRPASVALLDGEKLISEYTQCTALTHSRTLLPMAEDLLKNAELSLSDVDGFAVSQGPGSFTGIRIGVSTVKGLSWASGKPCAGVSTLEAMAYNGISRGGIVCPVMDARRGQVYNALFEIIEGEPVRLCEDRAISLEELSADLGKYSAPPYLVGDGAQLCRDYLEAAGIPCAMAPENLRWQSAWGVAMAARGKSFAGADELLPVYLRLSQAERERQENLK